VKEFIIEVVRRVSIEPSVVERFSVITGYDDDCLIKQSVLVEIFE
jgi:hypothetical protein